MAGEVFVSYSQSDRDCALELVAYAESQGISCWIAPRDISPSADWASEIIDAISAARVMVLVFSASSNHSPQVRREVERAVHKQLSILPFRLEDVLPERSLEFFLSTQHWLDAFPPPREAHYRALCAHLHTILGSPASPTEQPVSGSYRHVDAGLAAPDILRQIELQLAAHIGPVARPLVRRAAATAVGTDELILKLAQEIEAEDDQRRFIRACRQIKTS